MLCRIVARSTLVSGTFLINMNARMKKSHTYFAILTAVAALCLTAASQTGAFSIRELLGLGEGEDQETAQAAEQNTPAQPAAPQAGQQAKDWGKPSQAVSAEPVTLAQVQQVLANVDDKQRRALLADQDAFQKFIHQEAGNASVLAAAKANNLEKDANTVFLMQRGAENILRETYLERLIASKVPADFPSDAQVKEYFDKNRDKLVIGERVHVWQIFLPLDKDASAKKVGDAEKQAARIIDDLKQGKIDFTTAALKYSGHEASKNNGGYLGLVKVADLKPEISKPLLALDEGKLSTPIRTDEGIHILKRGVIVPAQTVSLDEIKPQIRQLLINQARAQLRNAIYEQAKKTYPVELQDAKIEEWRLRLKTNLETPATATAPAAKP